LSTEKEKNLRKIIVTTWITLDGFLAGPNGEIDWIMVDETMGKNALFKRQLTLTEPGKAYV